MKVDDAAEILSDLQKEQEEKGLFWIPDLLTVELGIQLIPWAETHILQDWIRIIRHNLGLEYGIHLAPVRLRDAADLSPSGYRILLHGDEVARGKVTVNHLLAIDTIGDTPAIDGVQVLDPVDGNLGYWIEPENEQKAIEAGYFVVEAVTVLSTHVSKVAKDYVHHLLGLQETANLLKALRKTHPAMVEGLTLIPLELVDIYNVLRGLLRDDVPIRDLPVVITTLADYGRDTKDTEALIGYVKGALKYE